MTQLWAILADSFHESVDRKSLLVLLFLAALLIAFCFGISFETEKPGSALEKQALSFGSFGRMRRLSFGSLFSSMDWSAGEIKPVENSEGWRPELTGGYALTLTFKPDALDEMVRRWRPYKKERDTVKREVFKDIPPDNAPVRPGDRIAFIEGRFAQFGYSEIQTHFMNQNPPTYRVALHTAYPYELNSASSMILLYGALKVPLWNMSVAEQVVRIELFLANGVAGFLGVIVAVLACAGFVPSMLQKGTLDLLLARPVGRRRLLLFKYLGGLWFVLILTTVLIGGCWIAIALRTGYSSPWFLASILTVTAIFAVVHSVAVLAGVLTRSGTISALLAIGVWGVSSTLVFIRDGIDLLYAGQMVPAWAKSLLNVLYAIAPKTLDLASLNTYFLSHSHLSESAYQRSFAGTIPKVEWGYSIGTTAIFTAVMLGLAMWTFRRKDY